MPTPRRRRKYNTVREQVETQVRSIRMLDCPFSVKLHNQPYPKYLTGSSLSRLLYLRSRSFRKSPLSFKPLLFSSVAGQPNTRPRPERPASMLTNIVTGAIRTKAHHCTICKKATRDRCLKYSHVAHCTAIGPRGRECGELFTVRSQGCQTHPYRDGHNVNLKGSTGTKAASFASRSNGGSTSAAPKKTPKSRSKKRGKGKGRK